MYRIRHDRRGLSLIEVVVSAALLGIVSLLLATAITSTFAAVSLTRQRNNDTLTAANEVESKHAASSAGSNSGTMTVSFSDVTCNVPGSYVDATSGNVTFKEFVPN